MKNQPVYKWTLPVLVVVLAACVPSLVWASNFQLTEQSVTSLGSAHAAGAAYASDASTIWYNPAGLTRLSGAELDAGLSVIRFGANFTPTTAVDAAGQPLTGNNGGNPGKLGAVPFIYYSTPLTDKLAFGIGLGVPFGLATSYNANSIFRYQAIYTGVTVLNLNPTLAYKFNDNWSAGFGVDVQKMDVKLTNDVDFGAVCFSKVNPVNCTAMNLTPQSHDGFFQGTASNTHVGFNFGVLWQNDTTRVGFAYRSRVKHDLTGSASFTNAPALFTSAGLFQSQGISAQFTTPQIVSLSLYQQLDDKWSLMADWSYTGWSSFQNLTINFADPGMPPTTVQEGLSNSNRFAVGANYKFNDQWTFRGGVALDKSPVPNPSAPCNSVTPPAFATCNNSVNASRTARLPDADRKWIAVGASWKVSDRSQWDIGYAHLFINSHIPYSQLDGSSGDYINGQFKADADILGIQYIYKF
ncbi:MAG: outer membrane protein transport protein [Gammaproteobacteria bacterium]|nr:OmpP1/FadL family transporter [Gammaproteobacteria bacterium]MBU6508577.1 OmpP1/FadL family transporter [Gammaproteobacteria bacterium]MDE1983312.1 outer membrane protein transport protein [Gammaproteobacteria bacterium]MDE2460715.1 outer membrane protein transport protein [Gammaproteobacteria bacterium]